MGKRNLAGTTVGQICRALEAMAPPKLAQDWDNVGLLAGDEQATVRRMLLCIDLTKAVVDEAVAGKTDFVMAYHPPLFRPISRVLGQSRQTDAHLFHCIRNGIAVYSMHTALDAAMGGTNDCLAGVCGVTETRPFEYARPGKPECKVVVFVPEDAAGTVSEAMFAAGAGRIGEYAKCSYRLAGEGTFQGSDATNPAVGQAGRFERVPELRIETVTAAVDVPAVIEAIRRTHPYEEPAFDVYPLEGHPVYGIGRIGPLAKPVALGALARNLRSRLQADCTAMVGQADRIVRRAILCAGSAGSLPFRQRLESDDVIITGEMRHHDALTVLRHGASAITLGHWSSERHALHAVADHLRGTLAAVEVGLSTADCEPFRRP
jgi:dinuclear metal center YbgI/SA1388 family protein